MTIGRSRRSSEHPPAGLPGAQHLALQRPAVERRVLRLARQLAGRHLPGCARGRTGTDRPARRFASRPAAVPSSAAGPPVSSSIARSQRQAVAMHLRQRDPEQGRQARRRPGDACANGRRLSSASRGWWSEATASMVPSASAGADRQPVGFGAQRRRQLGVGAEIADRGLVQVEIGRRGIAGHRAAPRPWRGGSAASASAVETWAKCTAPPVSRASRMSRATRIASAAAGMPGRPSRVASSPSVAAPPAASDGSSGMLDDRARRSRARRTARAASAAPGRCARCAVGEGDRAGLAQQAESRPVPRRGSRG